MPSEGKAAWNKEYYKKNADDILYRAKQERKAAKTIFCPCSETSFYKDVKDNKRKHFATLKHRSYEQKLVCVKILTRDFKYKEDEAKLKVDKQITNKCGDTYLGKEALKQLVKFEFELRDKFILHKENKDKPNDSPFKKESPFKNIVMKKEEIDAQPLQQPIANPLILLPVTAKNAIIPEHDGQGFDPLKLIKPLGWENDVPEREPPRKMWYQDESEDEDIFN